MDAAVHSSATRLKVQEMALPHAERGITLGLTNCGQIPTFDTIDIFSVDKNVKSPKLMLARDPRHQSLGRAPRVAGGGRHRHVRPCILSCLACHCTSHTVHTKTSRPNKLGGLTSHWISVYSVDSTVCSKLKY